MNVDRSSLDALRIHRGEEHPPTRRALWIAGALLLIAAVALGWWVRRPSAPSVQVATARPAPAGSGTTALNATGYVTARRQATVSSKVTGKVIEVRIEEGMEVHEGEILARLDPATPEAGLRLTQAQAAAAASALRETEVRIEEARLELDRARSLARQRVASQSDLDRAQAQLDALEARLAAQRDELAVSRRQVQLREQDFEDTIIRAPFSGVVVSKNAQPGEMISPISAGGGFTRTGIGTIVDMSSLEIEVDVNEAYINRVAPGQPVRATLDAYPEWAITAHVITVVPAADRQKATVRVRIAIDESDPRILPDMGVKVAFLSGEAPAGAGSAVVIPRASLRRDGDRDVVFAVADGTVERRAVSVGAAQGDEVTILAGLRSGEPVVVGGPAELKDGDRVRVNEKP
jgi:RND family efflux transporter MFP subunit